MDQNFDWVTKAKRTTVLFRKIYDPVLGKDHYVKLNPIQLLREVYPRIRVLGRSLVLNIPDIYIKVPYETLTRKGKHITRQRYLPIAAIAATYEKQTAEGSVILPEEGCRIRCCKQLIQVYFDTATERFTRLIDKFWPQSLELRLWSWDYYPGTA